MIDQRKVVECIEELPERADILLQAAAHLEHLLEKPVPAAKVQPAAAKPAAKPRKAGRVSGTKVEARANGGRVSTEQVYQVVVANTGVEHDAIARQLKTRDVRYQLGRLEAAGRIARGGDGKWRRTVTQPSPAVNQEA